MAQLKRDPIKYLRDGIKSQYKKGTKCYICGDTKNLEYHHYTPLVYLADNFQKDTGILFDNVETVMEERDKFYDKYKIELIDDCITLCKMHHARLHSIYGKTYSGADFITKKVRRWVNIQKDKHELDK